MLKGKVPNETEIDIQKFLNQGNFFLKDYKLKTQNKNDRSEQNLGDMVKFKKLPQKDGFYIYSAAILNSILIMKYGDDIFYVSDGDIGNNRDIKSKDNHQLYFCNFDSHIIDNTIRDRSYNVVSLLQIGEFFHSDKDDLDTKKQKFEAFKNLIAEYSKYHKQKPFERSDISNLKQFVGFFNDLKEKNDARFFPILDGLNSIFYQNFKYLKDDEPQPHNGSSGEPTQPKANLINVQSKQKDLTAEQAVEAFQNWFQQNENRNDLTVNANYFTRDKYKYHSGDNGKQEDVPSKTYNINAKKELNQKGSITVEVNKKIKTSKIPSTSKMPSIPTAEGYHLIVDGLLSNYLVINRNINGKLKTIIISEYGLDALYNLPKELEYSSWAILSPINQPTKGDKPGSFLLLMAKVAETVKTDEQFEALKTAIKYYNLYSKNGDFAENIDYLIKKATYRHADEDDKNLAKHLKPLHDALQNQDFFKQETNGTTKAPDTNPKPEPKDTKPEPKQSELEPKQPKPQPNQTASSKSAKNPNEGFFKSLKKFVFKNKGTVEPYNPTDVQNTKTSLGSNEAPKTSSNLTYEQTNTSSVNKVPKTSKALDNNNAPQENITASSKVVPTSSNNTTFSDLKQFRLVQPEDTKRSPQSDKLTNTNQGKSKSNSLNTSQTYNTTTIFQAATNRSNTLNSSVKPFTEEKKIDPSSSQKSGFFRSLFKPNTANIVVPEYFDYTASSTTNPNQINVDKSLNSTNASTQLLNTNTPVELDTEGEGIKPTREYPSFSSRLFNPSSKYVVGQDMQEQDNHEQSERGKGNSSNAGKSDEGNFWRSFKNSIISLRGLRS